MTMEQSGAVGIQKSNWAETSRRMRGGGNRERFVKGYSLSAGRWTLSEELMHGLVTVVSNTVLCAWNLLRES